MSQGPIYLEPEWPAPEHINAYSTTRIGGLSSHEFSSFNLAMHVNDAPEVVQQNRELLKENLQLPKDPCWLDQVHSNKVIDASPIVQKADASYTTQKDTACIVLTADCLPILVTDTKGEEVAAIIANTIAKFTAPGKDILVWLGPCISRDVYQVDDQFRDTFLEIDPNYKNCFTADPPHHWLADLPAIAWYQFNQLGIENIYGGEFCTYQGEEYFYSYRRQAKTGRQACLIWIG